jgi:Flp pilus assembly protein TadD
MNSKDSEALRGRGRAHLELHQTDAAILDLSAAIALNVSDARAYRYRALAYEAKKDVRHADLDFAAAARLDPKGRTEAR